MFLTKEDAEQNIALLDEEFTSENDAILQEYCNENDIDLSELTALSEQKTIVRFNKNAKMAQLTGKAASIIAKEKNDPNFKKMMFHRRKYIEFKRKIHAKYSGLSLKRAKMAFKTGKLVEPASTRSF